jgi:hypothetical protein
MKGTLKLLRQKNALERLEAQLKSGVKTKKKSIESIPLTDVDIIRIKKEIVILKKKITK